MIIAIKDYKNIKNIYMYDTETNQIKDMFNNIYCGEKLKLENTTGTKSQVSRRILVNFCLKDIRKQRLLNCGYHNLHNINDRFRDYQFINKDGVLVVMSYYDFSYEKKKILNKKGKREIPNSYILFTSYRGGKCSNYSNTKLTLENILNIVFVNPELIKQGFIHLKDYRDIKNFTYMFNKDGKVYSLLQNRLINETLDRVTYGLINENNGTTYCNKIEFKKLYLEIKEVTNTVLLNDFMDVINNRYVVNYKDMYITDLDTHRIIDISNIKTTVLYTYNGDKKARNILSILKYCNNVLTKK